MAKKFSFLQVLTILLCLSVHSTNAQIQPIQGCSLQGVEFQDCAAAAENSASTDACCRAMNRAAQAGFYCLCLVLRSSAPLLGLALSFQLQDCAISVPPLTQCQNQLPVFQTPDPQQPEEHATSSDVLVPVPPEADEILIPQNATLPSKMDDHHLHDSELGNMKSHGGERFKIVLNPGLFLVLVAPWAII